MAVTAAAPNSAAVPEEQKRPSSTVKYEDLVEAETSNPRQLAEVKFIENVEEFCFTRAPTDCTEALNELLSKFKYAESGIMAQRSTIKSKQPDIISALELVKHLKEKREAQEQESLDVKYQLAECIYATANIPLKNDKIMLWLGANVMLEYSFDEAIELLSGNKKNAEDSLVHLNEDAAFLKDQITTTEVNIARCHNYGVKVRAQEKARKTAEETSIEKSEE